MNVITLRNILTKSEYDVLIGRISSIYAAILAEGLSDEAATVSVINTNYHHSKVHSKTLEQIWTIGLGPIQHTLKTTTQVGIRHAVHPLTRRYKTDIIHCYNSRSLNTTMYFDTLFPKCRSLNGNTHEQLFTDTEFISLHPSKSKAEAGNFLNVFIGNIGIPMNTRFDHAT